MAKIRIMGKTGDSVVATWEPTDLETKDPEALAAIAEAERIFNEGVAGGGAAFAINPVTGESTGMLKDFDPHAEEILIALPLSGG